MAFWDEEEDEEARRRRQAIRPRRVVEPAAVEELAAPGVIDLKPLPAGTAPYVPPEESRDPPNMRVAGRNVFRPELNQTGDALADVQEYRRQLEGYTDPKAKDKWYMAAVKRLIPGGAAGYAATHTLAGALGGAGVSAAHAAFNPDVTERDWRDREKIKAAGLEQQELARRSANVDYAGKVADIGYKQSRAAYEDARPELERERNEANVKRIEAGISAGLERLKHDNRRLDQNDERIKLTRERQQQLREQTAANLRYRKEKDVLDRAERREARSESMRQRQAELAERVRARVAAERDRQQSMGLRVKALRISEAKARAWAENEGIKDFDDMIDALDEAGIEIKDK